MFLLPSFLAVIAVVARKRFYDCLLHVDVTGTLYLSVASIPSLWNLYILFLMIYLLSIVWMKEKYLKE